MSSTIGIVIPVLNQLQYTKDCLQSLHDAVDPFTELVIINNGSTDGTSEYLNKYQNKITLIENKENLGCAKAWNQGVKALSTDWIVILNNDVLVTNGWLSSLRNFAEEESLDIVSPAIREFELSYDLELYANSFVKKMHKHSRIGIADGICFMVSNKVFDKIGLFDERFRVGQYEDADFFYRAELDGFKLGTTGRSFIHHFGSITQKDVKKIHSKDNYALENRAYYNKKWKLHWIKRMNTRRKLAKKIEAWKNEELKQGHSLKEKEINGQLCFF